MQCRASCSRGVVPLPTNIFFGWLVSWQDQIHGHLKRLNDDTARDHIGFGWNLFARTPFFKLGNRVQWPGPEADQDARVLPDHVYCRIFRFCVVVTDLIALIAK